jgi:hypothetical protein
MCKEQIIVGGFGTCAGQSHMCVCTNGSSYIINVIDFRITFCLVAIC